MHSQKKEVILIVDDEPFVSEMLTELVSSFGYLPQCIQNSEDVLLWVKNNFCDLILLDINMPAPNGFEILKQLKSLPEIKEIPVIILTGRTDDRVLVECLDQGAVDFLTKPIYAVALNARLRSALAIKRERDRYKDLMLKVLPKKIAKEMVEFGHSHPRLLEEITVVFTDFQGFTQAAARWKPEQLIYTLSNYFYKFDQVVEKYGLERLKTIGDGYMFAGGVPEPVFDHCERCIQAAVEIREIVKTCTIEEKLSIRIGVHSGSAMAGVIGHHRFAYDLWGTTVNLASRLESIAPANSIAITNSVYEKINKKFTCAEFGRQPLKGIGEANIWLVSTNPEEI